MTISPAATAPAPVSTSAVPPARSAPIGWHLHRRAVQALVDSYRAIPAGTPVRLAKSTSNLFRPRAAAAGPGLDVSGLHSVIAIDVAARTADVQGMCSYEDLVAATLVKGLMPAVVPQLKTITLGGAVTGLGIESTSFRNGLPHESVLELDVLTGDGEIVTATADNEHADLFRAFPNSYGTLGYAVRVRITLEPVQPYVALRNVRAHSPEQLTELLSEAAGSGRFEGRPVDFLDGVLFSADEGYAVIGTWAQDVPTLSDYTGEAIYYRSLAERGHDALTVHDYLWRWDTDWFWCSRAFGAQQPWLRRVWPARLRRSDVYHRIVGWENRYRVMARIDALRGLPARERVVQDVEVPIEATAPFLRWYLEHVPMTPVWLCPLRLAAPAAPGSHPWPLYPLPAGRTFVNVGFWGTVPIEAGRSDGDVNRDVERAVAEHEGHKSLYSDAYYPPEEFWAAYGGSGPQAPYPAVKRRYDPAGRLLDLYAKTVGRR